MRRHCVECDIDRVSANNAAKNLGGGIATVATSRGDRGSTASDVIVTSWIPHSGPEVKYDMVGRSREREPIHGTHWPHDADRRDLTSSASIPVMPRRRSRRRRRDRVGVDQRRFELARYQCSSRCDATDHDRIAHELARPMERDVPTAVSTSNMLAPRARNALFDAVRFSALAESCPSVTTGGLLAEPQHVHPPAGDPRLASLPAGARAHRPNCTTPIRATNSSG